MKQYATYRTVATYQQWVAIRGAVLRYMKCWHCESHVWIDAMDKVQPHYDGDPARLCESSNRFWNHPFGSRMKEEQS